jgi:D-arginine dehydrogenase
MTIDSEEQFYIKPEAGRLLGSPADETPVPPSDVQPEELDIAHAVDRIERATTLRVRALTRKWAGLRNFFADKLPAVGPDASAASFFWLAGQGGYGIMTAPAMARVAAAHVLGENMPDELTDLGFEASALLPARLVPDEKRA